MEGKCYCCGRAGHKSPQCRFKDRPAKEEWAMNKVQQGHAQMQAATDTSSVTNPTSSNLLQTQQGGKNQQLGAGWAGMHIQFHQAMLNDMKNWILLDNQSSDTIFCNPEYVAYRHSWCRPADGVTHQWWWCSGHLAESHNSRLGRSVV